MVRVVMFDLGNTIIRDPNSPGASLFPGAREALAELNQLASATPPMDTCLVSDFLAAEPPTEQRRAELFAEYLAILDRFQLRPLFEPVDKRVTLSTQAGVTKPDRAIFELAVKRLGLQGVVGLSQCALVTEELEHLSACRELGMTTIQFLGPVPGVADFRVGAWSEIPPLIAQLRGHGG